AGQETRTRRGRRSDAQDTNPEDTQARTERSVHLMTFIADPIAPASEARRADVEKAVQAAEINALRMALYQATEDPELRTLDVRRELRGPNEAVVVSDADAQIIRDKAVEFLLSG